MNSASDAGDTFVRIWSAHGDQLRWIAATILRDAAAAQTVVVDVITAYCARPPRPDGGLLPSRHELARLTYLHCLRAGAVSDRIDGRPQRDRFDSTVGSIVIVGLRVLAQHQRAVLALVQLGDHSCDDVADLLGLPTEVAAQLLASGLREAEPAPAPGREPGPGVVELLALVAHQ
ncbi:hypothetical protein [Kribbella sindirgiensis]|uniref:RNA polymerase sigma factor 70 region 4 type 2 domain-containing protein n=1 Tax=Kribbella sindirgiensis TaxID=1124744 RepID=A0A4R0I482_9ACTN|nr:hypothetical protein [Kribbella sindirgiensis]TCC21284.1 hypothetical protein E0H50_36195 [Kribbella sindirgiensis]